MNELTYIPDCLFPSDNDLEVPTLRLDRQPKFVEIPFVCFGEQKRTFNMMGNGTLHFYTDDYRFSAVYEHPEKVLQHNPRNIVEPNFSVFSETPVAFGLQAIYKKRFIARSMQEKGIGVFVDLNVNSKFYKLNMLGVPIGYKSYCTRGYSDRLDYLEFEYELARQWAADNADEMLFVIYGGGAKCKEFAKRNRCVYVSPMVVIKNKQKSAKKALDTINGTIAFVEDEFDVKHLLESTTRQIVENQITDYSQLKQIKNG